MTPGELLRFRCGSRISDPISVSEMGSAAAGAVGQPNSTASVVKATRPDHRQPGGRGKSVGKAVGKKRDARRARLMTRTSSFREKPLCPQPRRRADWLNPTGARKVHSLIDKVYQRKNLEMAWETVKANRGSGGVDGQSLDGFAAQLDQQWDRLQRE